MHFAEVYPLTRLPRRFGVFDYQCDEMVHAGDLVVIPFKGRELFGIVRHIKDTAGTKKRISNILRVKTPSVCTRQDLERFESIAKHIVQSPSTLLYQAFLGIDKTPQTLSSIPRKTARVNEKIITFIQSAQKNNARFLQGNIETLIVFAYQQAVHLDGQLLIIAPHERDAEMIAAYLPKDKRIACLHGHTPPAVRSSIISGWKAGEIDILVGTKQASLLPAHRLTIGLLYYPTHKDHVAYDRNPRFDAAEALRRICKQHGASLYACGPLPRIPTAEPSGAFMSNAIRVVDLTADDQITTAPFLSHTLQQTIQSTLTQKKRAIVLYNKKGYAKRLLCKDCGHIPFCGSCGAVPKLRENDLLCPVCHVEMWIPAQCPSCGGEDLRPRGIGNKRLLKTWQNIFPDAKIAIVDKGEHRRLNADILLVTEFFFESLTCAFQKWHAGVVADACADLHMSHDADAGLQTASRLHRLALFAAQQQAPCIVQTWTPTLINPMTDAPAFIKQERQTRITYQLPPFSYRVAIRIRGKQQAPFGELKTLQLFVEKQEDMHWFETGERIEILTKPDDYGILLPYLQKLPDACIILITYA